MVTSTTVSMKTLTMITQTGDTMLVGSLKEEKTNLCLHRQPPYDDGRELVML